MLQPGDGAIDVIKPFSIYGSSNDKIDLRLFGPNQTCQYPFTQIGAQRTGDLIVNGERVANITGDFDIARDVVIGCGSSAAAAATAAPALQSVEPYGESAND